MVELGEVKLSCAAAEARAEIILRIHGYQTYIVAQYNVMQRQKDVFPYWKYITAGDDRVREAHRALDGKIFPADSPFWQTHFPPWDRGCRCQIIPVSVDEAEEIRAEDATLPPEERRLDGNRRNF